MQQFLHFALFFACLLAISSAWSIPGFSRDDNDKDDKGQEEKAKCDEPGEPEMPTELKELTEAEQKCLAMFYIKSKLAEDKKVNFLAKQACYGIKGSSLSEIMENRKKSDGWCALDQEKLHKLASLVVKEQTLIPSAPNGAKLYGKVADKGIWLAFYKPECAKDEEKEKEKDA